MIFCQGHFIFFLTYMREIWWTTPKRTTLLGKPRILWKRSFSVSKKRGVISRFIKSLSFVSKLLLIYLDLPSSHLHIFTLSHIETKIRALNQGLFSNLFATFSSFLFPWYCWWKKSCTTQHVWNPVNNRIFTISTGDRRISEPSTVASPNPSKTGLPQRLWLH